MRTLKLFMAASIFAAFSWASIPAHPGMLNYVEGNAKIDGVTVTNKSVGSADVEQGQIIETGQGKAEILLTPGIFLRLGDHSAGRMLNPGLAETQVELLHGHALVEATDLYRGNHIQIIDGATTTTLDKNGLYAFNADQPRIAVYDGKATVTDGDRHQDLKKGRQLDVAAFQVSKFDTKQGDELYRWSDLRSQYLSEASLASARTYVVDGAGWLGAGWYWNPWWGCYSFLPGDGFLYSPFGWGFYAPRYLSVYRYYNRPGFYNHPGFYGAGRSGNGFVAHGPMSPGGRGFSTPLRGVATPHFGGGFRGGRR